MDLWNHEQYKKLERLTQKEFVHQDKSAITAPVAGYGVMFASWVTGDFLVKQIPENGLQDVTWEQWDKKVPVIRLTFKNGILISSQVNG